MLSSLSALKMSDTKFKDCTITPKDTLYKGGAISSTNSQVNAYNSEFSEIKSENGACIYAINANENTDQSLSTSPA
jgi:hypothetical protein